MLIATMTGCQSDDDVLTIAVKSDCDQTVTIAAQNSVLNWSVLTPGQVEALVVDGVDSNGTPYPFRFAIAVSDGQNSDPEIWLDNTIQPEDVSVKDGVDSEGTPYEALATIEGDLCP